MTGSYRYTILLICLLSGIIYCKAQTVSHNNDNDSLRYDSLEAVRYYNLAIREFGDQNYDRSLAYAENSLNFTLKTADKETEGKSLVLLGQIYSISKKNEQALKYFLKAENIYNNLEDNKKQNTIYNGIAAIYFSLGAFEKSHEYYCKAYNSARTEGSPDELRNIIERAGLTAYKAGKYDKGIVFYEELLTLEGISDNKTDKIKTLDQIIRCCNNVKLYDKALRYNKEIYSIYEKEGNTEDMAIIMNNMGYNHVNLGDHENAISCFSEALMLSEEHKDNILFRSALLTNIGICYQNMEQYDNSIKHLRKATDILSSYDDPGELARVQNIIALVYFRDEDLHNAVYFSKYSVENAERSGNRHLLQECYYTYSVILKEGNDYIKALEYYEKYLDIRDSLLVEKRLKEQEAEEKRFDIEKEEKELKLKYKEEEMREMTIRQLKLQLDNEEKEKEILAQDKELLQKQRDVDLLEKHKLRQSLEIAHQKHQVEIREREKNELEQKNRIQDLVLMQKEREKKQQEQEINLLEAQKKNQQLQLEKETEARKKAYWMIGLAAIIAILIFLGLLSTRRKNQQLAKQKRLIEEKNQDLEQKNEEIMAQKESLQEANTEIQKKNVDLQEKSEEIMTQNDHITRQKEEIELKNKDITDSIQYASRIQTAVLAPIETVKSILPESFILFKPKDIVSGDFYWFTRQNGRIYIAAADCTGHGVPGAFMSMLGSTFLNEILNNNANPSADLILNELRNNVMNSLRQKGEEGEAKDGMDIAMCVIDKSKNIIEFSGAHNPLYIISNGELKKIDGDRMPIGIHGKSDIPFKNHIHKIRKDETYYIFSDGYADQFGGGEGKKFKYKQFQELLINIHTQPMEEQKEILNSSFEEWRGDYTQIDDVLVIGMKIDN